jgi:NADH dehydrogenase FAD-containing subunit
MKILNIMKTAPDASTKKIIEVQSAGNQVTTSDLTKGGISYDKLVADVFSHDKVFCW